MVCGSLIVNNKMLEISKLLEECGLSQPPYRSFACYFFLGCWQRLDVSCPNSAAFDVLRWFSFTGGGSLFIENETSQKSTNNFKFLQTS